MILYHAFCPLEMCQVLFHSLDTKQAHHCKMEKICVSFPGHKAIPPLQNGEDFCFIPWTQSNPTIAKWRRLVFYSLDTKQSHHCKMEKIFVSFPGHKAIPPLQNGEDLCFIPWTQSNPTIAKWRRFLFHSLDTKQSHHCKMEKILELFMTSLVIKWF